MHRVDLIHEERKREPAMPPSYAPLGGPCTTGDLVQYLLTLEIWSELAVASHWPTAEMLIAFADMGRQSERRTVPKFA
jgi:predicted metal-binding membrane protein